MSQEKEKIEIYKINDKKYTVITNCIENPNKEEKLYNLLCKYSLSKLSKKNIQE